VTCLSTSEPKSTHTQKLNL